MSSRIASDKRSSTPYQPPLSSVIFDGRYIQDRYHGIGRYAFHLVKELASVMPQTNITLLREPDAPETRFDLSALQSNRNVTIRNLRAPLFSLKEQVMLATALASGREGKQSGTNRIYHSPYFALPWLLPPVPAILTVHDCIFERDSRYMPRRWARLYYGLLMRASLTRARFTAVPSQATARDLRRFYKVQPHKIVVTPEAADPSFRPLCAGNLLDEVRKRYNLPEKFVMAVGARRPHKNFVRVVRAMRDLEQAELVFVGDADERFADEAAEESKALSRRVHFLGRVPEEHLPLLYNLATVVACPSLMEGFGLPVLEAMACGTPVVCSDIPVFKEVAGEAALYAPCLDTKVWTERLQLLLDDPGRQAQLRHLGLARASLFTWHRGAEALLPAYTALNAERLIANG